jgi:ATP-dependent helicase/nuclease subunit A
MSGPGPRASQWQAIRDADRHVLVVAGAGTGKTFTVVQRILYVLGVPVCGETYARPAALHEIAAITFTNQAAKELKEDLRKALRANGRRADAYRVDDARIGTIHGFCADILREHALRRGRPPVTTVLEEGESLARATVAARDTLVQSLEEGSVAGLADLLAQWETGKVDVWVNALMRKPDLLAALEREPEGLDAREQALVALALRALRRHDERLAYEGAIDFDRMVLWTRDLLRDDANARRSLQRRLRLLIIDEFQDVDPAQKEIAWAIGGLGAEGDVAPRLMLVGDPKQSIYRFRNADVTVWNAVQRQFEHEGAGGFHVLEENFRSVPAILGFVDASVGALLGPPGGERAAHEVEFRPVQATRDGQGVPHGVELIVIPAAADGNARKGEEARLAEAAAIARRARELFDVEQRPWRDMALLLAAWTHEPAYTAALRAAGVPVYVLRDEGFYEQREVLDVVNALETLRDPADDRALMGFLRGPFVGLRDDSLLAIARQVPQPYWRKLRSAELALADESERLMRAEALLWRYVELRDRVPAAALLEALLRETGFLAHHALRGDEGRQAIANVRRFLAMARESEDAGVGDLLRTIRESRERKDRVAQARLYAASENVMLVTSIHVSKGLEWPVVFWADVASPMPHINDKLIVGRDSIRLGADDAKPEEQDEGWQALREQLKLEMEAERKRLWYVAATRAKDRLIVSPIPRPRAIRASLAHELLERFPALASGSAIEYEGADNRRYRAAVRIAEPMPADGDARPGDPAEPLLDPETTIPLPLVPVASPEGLQRHSATEFLAHARCPWKQWLKHTVGIREPAFEASHEQLVSAVARGQIVHDVLEHEGEAGLDDLLEAAIGRWDEDAPPPESERGVKYRAHLTDEVTRVLEHPEYAALAARPGARRELSFLHVRPDGSALQGFIDLAAPAAAGEGLELLDVKTTQCGAAEAREIAGQYGPQRDVYVTAAGAISGRPVERFAFQFSRARVQVAEPLDAEARADAARRADLRAKEIASGGAALTSHPEECRFCGYRRVGLCAGVHTGERDVEAVLARVRRNRFRRSFRMGEAELKQLREKGLETMLDHARAFVDQRLAPAEPENDGTQTPFRGHPVFVAQHATATCCRDCLEKWHGIKRGVDLAEAERGYIVRVLARWLEVQAGVAEAAGGQRGAQLDLL